METQLKHVALSEISVSATNKMFRDESEMQTNALADLIASVKEKGVIQPVLLRPQQKNGNNVYELVCGERRYRASKAAALKNIPAYIRPLTDEEALEAQVIENLQRENVNPMKEAIAFEWMVKTKKLSTKQISDRIGKSIDYVQERIRLTALNTDAQNFVRNGVLPLKAGLKLASIPQNLQADALRNCIDTVEGTSGRTHTFKGLERLQRWLESNVFSELALADFNINDANLVPAAGSCLSCTKRTRNAGGLFDDVAKKDMCLDGGCFVAKQFAVYEEMVKQAKLNFIGAKIIFKTRSWDLSAPLKSKLSKLAEVVAGYSSPGTEINKAEALKGLEVEKGKDPSKIIVAIMVGPCHDKEDLKKKMIFYTTAKAKQSKASGAQRSAVVEKEKASQAIQKKVNELEPLLVAQAAAKKFQTKTLPEKIIRGLIVELMQENSNEDNLIEPLLALGIKFKMDHGKNTIVYSGDTNYAPILQAKQDGYWIDDLEKIVDSVKGDKLNALAAFALSTNFYGNAQDKFFKEYKVDVKAATAKAKSEATAWYKSEQSKKKVAVKKFVKVEGRKPGK